MDHRLTKRKLRKIGGLGHIDLNQMSPELTDAHGAMTPFNMAADRILVEARESQIFAVMASLIKKGVNSQ